MERFVNTPCGRIYFSSMGNCPRRGYDCPVECVVPDIIPDDCPCEVAE
jgi:hypothetical protein